MNIQEKYEKIGEAVMKEYATHGSKKITVTISDEKILAYLFVSVDIHPVAIFSEREMLQMMENT